MMGHLRLAEPNEAPPGPARATSKALTIALIVVALAACSPSSTTIDSGANTPTPPPAADLTSERIQTELGSPPFEPVNWQRTVGAFTAIGDDRLPDPAQIALMTAATAEIPDQVTATPRSLVRTSSVTGPSDAEGAHAVALALGPDIYLLDPVFDLDGGTTRLNLAYALTHELVHVEQWYALDPAYVAASRAGEISEIVLADGSTSVAAFAAATGWTDTDPDPIATEWVLSGDAVASSPYGATSPVEDMADTVAWAAMGRTNWLDQAHLDWLQQWAGVPAATFATAKPWSPSGSQEVLSADAVFDETQVANLLDSTGSIHAEPLYFELPGNIAEPDAFVAELSGHLTDRAMTGTLTRLADDRLPRYAGSFTRPDGTLFWVEFWDFRSSDLGPTTPILTYVLVW